MRFRLGRLPLLVRWGAIPVIVTLFFLFLVAFSIVSLHFSPSDDEFGFKPVADSLPDGAIMRLGDPRWRFGEHEDEIDRYTFLPDGSGLVACGHESIRIFDSATGGIIRDVRGHRGDYFLSAAISPDSRYLAATKLPGIITVWEIATGERVRVWPDRAEKTGPYIHHLAFSPDGKQLLTSGSDEEQDVSGHKAIHLWDIESGKLLRKWHTDQFVRQVGFAPNGKAFFALTDDIKERGFVRWSADQAAPISSIALPDKSNCCVSRDGSMLAISLEQGGVVFWDSTTGKEIGKLREQKLQPGKRIAFSWDGKTLWTVSPSNTPSPLVSAWQVPNGKLIREFSHAGSTYGTPFPSPNPRVVAFLRDGYHPSRLEVCNSNSGKPLFAGHGHFISVAAGAFSGDGTTLLSLDWSGQLLLWDLKTGMPVTKIRTERAHERAVAVGQSGSFLIGDDFPSGVRVIDAKTGIQVANFTDNGLKGFDVEEICVVPGGIFQTQIRNFESDKRMLARWDASSGQLLATAQIANKLECRFADKGKLRVGIEETIVDEDIGERSRGRANSLVVYSGFGGELLWRRLLPGNHYAHVISSNDGYSVATVSVSSRDGRSGFIRPSSLQIWELATGGERVRVDPPEGDYHECLGSAIMSPDGRTLVVTWAGQTLRFFDTFSGGQLGELTATADLTPLTFSADGRRLATAVADCSILIWDVAKFTKRPNAETLAVSQLETSWRELGSDAKSAGAAMALLENSPLQAVSLFRQRLKPVEPIAAGRVEVLIVELRHAAFNKREAASSELERYGERAHAALRVALAQHPEAESRKRIEKLLSEPAVVQHGATRRHLRAIELVSTMGTSEAKALLQEWATGDPDSRVTQAAKIALER